MPLEMNEQDHLLGPLLTCDADTRCNRYKNTKKGSLSVILNKLRRYDIGAPCMARQQHKTLVKATITLPVTSKINYNRRQLALETRVKLICRTSLEGACLKPKSVLDGIKTKFANGENERDELYQSHAIVEKASEMDMQQENEQERRRRIRRISHETNQQTLHHHHHHHHHRPTPQFVARVISLPVAQESLCATQSMASQFGLGRVLLDHTHTMLQRLAYLAQQTQGTLTYRTYIQHNATLHRSLLFLDDRACSLLDFVETNVPLIQQPTAIIVDTLIEQPRQRTMATLEKALGTVGLWRDESRLWSRWKEGVDGLKQHCTGWTSHR